jgi:hypothetical protein
LESGLSFKKGNLLDSRRAAAGGGLSGPTKSAGSQRT